MNNITSQARDISYRALIACNTKEGFVAGSHHFVDLWARDSLFACFGALATKETKAVKQTIKTFLFHQRGDGLIPYLILRGHHSIGKYFGRHTYYKTPKAQFRSHLTFGTVPDGGILTIIAMRKYVEKTRDIAFITLHYKALQKAFAWYEKKFDGGLVQEWFSCEWADAVFKIGKTLYTNVLYYKAAKDMAWLAAKIKKTKDSHHYDARATSIASAIRAAFWTGSYFADWVDWKRQDYVATHPNMLAIIFGLTTEDEARSIIKIVTPISKENLILKNTDKPYPWWRIPPLHFMAGVPDYHNGLSWLQPGIMYAISLHTTGKVKDARAYLSGIAALIVKHDEVYEVYENNGKPVRRPFYRSEGPFAWSAGLFLYAHSMIYRR